METLLGDRAFLTCLPSERPLRTRPSAQTCGKDAWGCRVSKAEGQSPGIQARSPTLLRRAFELAEANGLSLRDLAGELKIKLPRLRLLLGQEDPRPHLQLV
jgi:hypothetical protein